MTCNLLVLMSKQNMSEETGPKVNNHGVWVVKGWVIVTLFFVLLCTLFKFFEIKIVVEKKN